MEVYVPLYMPGINARVGKGITVKIANSAGTIAIQIRVKTVGSAACQMEEVTFANARWV